MGKLNFDTLIKNNERAKIYITFGGGTAGPAVRLQGFTMSELRLSAGNTYTNPLMSQAQETLSDTIQGGEAVLSSLLGKFGANEVVPSSTLRTVAQTVNIWSGSDHPKFPISLLFIAMEETDDVTAMVKPLYRAVFPQFNDAKLSEFISPPLRYAPSGSKTATGLVQVQIGKWFRADKLLISHVDFTFSKETLASGKPLYATGAIQVETYRVVSYDEVEQWFIG